MTSSGDAHFVRHVSRHPMDVVEDYGVRYVLCTESTGQENEFELNPTVKWKLDIM